MHVKQLGTVLMGRYNIEGWLIASDSACSDSACIVAHLDQKPQIGAAGDHWWRAQFRLCLDDCLSLMRVLSVTKCTLSDVDCTLYSSGHVVVISSHAELMAALS